MRYRGYLLVLLILFLAAVGFQIWQHISLRANPTTADLTATLTAKNQSFKIGADLLRSGSATTAAAQLQSSLAQVSDADQQLLIKFYLGTAQEEKGDFAGAIGTWKEIAANGTYSSRTQAMAVQRMRLMQQRFLDPKITTEIFKEEPYKSMYVAGDKALSSRKLSEYALSKYGLATSALDAANWYAIQMLTGRLNATTSKAYSAKIHELVAIADTDIQKIKSGPSDLPNLLPALVGRAGLSVNMARLKDPIGDPEAAYKEILAIYQKGQMENDLTVRYYYASYLANTFGEARKTDVQNLLSKFSTADKSINKAIYAYLRNARTVPAVKARVIAVARLDSTFKTLLTTQLGWKASDF